MIGFEDHLSSEPHMSTHGTFAAFSGCGVAFETCNSRRQTLISHSHLYTCKRAAHCAGCRGKYQKLYRLSLHPRPRQPRRRNDQYLPQPTLHPCDSAILPCKLHFIILRRTCCLYNALHAICGIFARRGRRAHLPHVSLRHRERP